jgi:hypothetical protein
MRNSIYYEGFVLEPITKDMYLLSFDCDDSDINGSAALELDQAFSFKGLS